MAEHSKQPRKRKPVEQDPDTTIEVVYDEDRPYFGQIPHWLLFHPEVNDGERCTWLAIDSYANHASREGWPSLRTIAERRGKSLRVIYRHVGQLETVGALRRTQRWRANGSLTSSLYKMPWSKPYDPTDENVSTPPDKNVTRVVTKTSPPELDPYEPDPNEIGQETSPPSGEEGPTMKTKTRLRREMTLDEETAQDDPLVADKKAPKKPPGEVWQLSQFFYDEWARCRMISGNENLLHPGTQKVIGSRMKHLIEVEHIEPARLREMIVAFYKRVETGKVVVKSSTLVFAFMADRANAFDESRAKYRSPPDGALAHHPNKWVG